MSEQTETETKPTRRRTGPSKATAKRGKVTRKTSGVNAVKKEADRQKAAAEREKQKAVAKAEKSLPGLAKEINVRLGKVSKSLDDADNHRVSAALRLAEARDNCKAAGLKFGDWVEENIEERGLQECNRLAAIGAKGEEAARAQIADMRNKSAAASKAHRERQSSGGGSPTPSSGPKKAPPTKLEQARELLASVEDSKTAEAVAEMAAHEAGKKVVTEDQADIIYKRVNADPLELLKSDFKNLTRDQQIDFSDWAVEYLDD